MKILVFDIGGTSIKHGVCIDSQLQDTKETPTNAKLGGAHIIETIISLVEKESDFDAIGISTAGQVNAENGFIIYANSNIPNYTGTQIRKTLEERFHVPVMVENDVNSAAIGEAVYGSGKDFDQFLCLTYGTGVGGAIVQNKQIYHGSSFSAGEFGGMVIHGSMVGQNDDLFNGCYERCASTTALVKSVSEQIPSLTNGRLIFEHIHEEKVKSLVDAWIDEVVLGLITITHIFNPPCIVLGGGIMVQPYILEEVQKKLYQRIMPSFAHVKVVSATLGNSAGLLGINHLTLNYLAK